MDRMALPSPAVLKAAVERDGCKCVLCARPCGPDDAWRRAEPNAYGDTPDNFVAMCRECLPAQIGKAPPPARYIVHVHDTTPLRRVTRKALGWGIAGLGLTSWLALAGIVGWLLMYATRGFGSHLLATASILALLMVALQVWLGWTGRAGPPVQRVHYTYGPQVVRMEDR